MQHSSNGGGSDFLLLVLGNFIISSALYTFPAHTDQKLEMQQQLKLYFLCAVDWHSNQVRTEHEQQERWNYFINNKHTVPGKMQSFRGEARKKNEWWEGYLITTEKKH
uniref:Putative secreted protein n=1 Tax=Amblyomma tuberculatum TaxID=48802 RepID=A0A6M2E191_9ACAR